MHITNTQLAFSTVRKLAGPNICEREEFWALALGPDKKLIEGKLLFVGTVDACLVHPRDLFRFACLKNASSLIVAHNHPSGDPRPSLEDLLITERLLAASEIIQIPIEDHIIFTEDIYLSFRYVGLFEKSTQAKMAKNFKKMKFNWQDRVQTADERHAGPWVK